MKQDFASKQYLKVPLYPYALRRAAIRVHRKREHAIKWLAAVTWLGPKWLVTHKQERKAA